MHFFRNELNTDNCWKATWKNGRLFVCSCCRAIPAFMNNTIKQPNGNAELFQVSNCLKNGTFFCKWNPEESDPWISISVWVIQTLMTEELITRLGWGPCIFVCSSTVNAAVSTQTQTTPQTCLSSPSCLQTSSLPYWTHCVHLRSINHFHKTGPRGASANEKTTCM